MPTTFQLVETTFPNGEGKDTQEQINGVYDYLFVLLEQLRYTLFNLDGSNINQNALSEFIKNISEPIYAKIEDTDKNVNELSITAKGLAGRISDAEGNITQLGVIRNGFILRIFCSFSSYFLLSVILFVCQKEAMICRKKTN